MLRAKKYYIKFDERNNSFKWSFVARIFQIIRFRIYIWHSAVFTQFLLEIRKNWLKF